MHSYNNWLTKMLGIYPNQEFQTLVLYNIEWSHVTSQLRHSTKTRGICKDLAQGIHVYRLYEM